MSVGITEWAKANAGWTPSWVKCLGTAVWISDPHGNISYLNHRGEELFGREVSSCIGVPCHTVVRGVEDLGHPFCGTLCPIRRRAKSGREIEPVRLRINGGDKDRWVQVLPITVYDPRGSGPYVVHCVIDDDRPHRIEEYLTRVANRSGHGNSSSIGTRVVLTRREKEILRLLVEDQTLYAIATKLGVSHATVRNHVQHVLTKLGVHSIMEAVASYLLETDL